jgi:hypothetical protein
MNFVRQMGSGLFYALVSVVIVVGGLSLALAENNGTLPLAPTPSPSETVKFQIVPTTFSPTPTVTATITPYIVNPSPSATTGYPTAYYPTAYYPTAYPTLYYPPIYFTNTPSYSCGPFAGWIRGYTVQPGDTLYRIATIYRTTLPAMERANCKFGSNPTIYPGERLWVPNVPTVMPGATFIPTLVFSTATEFPTEPLTLTPLPYTETVIPSSATDPGQSQNP